MGLAKYHEDNIKINDGREYDRTVYVLFRSPKIYYDCYYCNRSFESVEGRNNHIREDHNVVGPLLFINGKIATSENYIQDIRTSKIVLCGFTNVHITVDGQEIDCEESEIDLKEFFEADKDFYEIKINQREFKIFKYSSINITNPEIENLIKEWGTKVDLNQTIDLLFRDGYSIQLNQAEERYLNGFKEYFIACSENINTKDRNNRYKEAYAILSSFNSLPPRARVVMKVIAFRWNWINKLENLSRISSGIFDVVIDFFHKKGSEQNINTFIGKEEYKIFIESNLAELINAIIAFQFEKWETVDRYLEGWTYEQISLIRDINTKDKILFLKARRLEKLGDNISADQYYRDIRTLNIRKAVESN